MVSILKPHCGFLILILSNSLLIRTLSGENKIRLKVSDIIPRGGPGSGVTAIARMKKNMASRMRKTFFIRYTQFIKLNI